MFVTLSHENMVKSVKPDAISEQFISGCETYPHPPPQPQLEPQLQLPPQDIF